MSSNLEDWEIQREAKHAVAHKGGPLTFLDGGGAAAGRREREEHLASDALSKEAGERRKKLIAANMKALRNSNFPDEVEYYRDVLRKLKLTPAEEAALKRGAVGKNLVRIKRVRRHWAITVASSSKGL